MKGKRMTTAEVEQAIDEHKIRADDPLQIAEEGFIKLNKLPYLFNHSCDPNAGINAKLELIALRHIEKGEEITYDYSTTVCTHSSWSMKCLCSSPACRKIIKNVQSLSPKQRKWYKAHKILQPFIAKEVL